MPANDTVVNAFILLVGDIDIFIGFITAALDFPNDNYASTPTLHPID